MPEKTQAAALREDCVRSAEIYLKYLEENKDAGKGMFRALVRSVQENLLDSSMALQTDREIKNADGMTLRVGETVYENTESTSHFLIRSVDRKQVVITPSAELAEDIHRALETKTNVYAEIDLTFLVKRVKEWYERRGEKVQLPSRKPEGRLAAGIPIPMSDNQRECAEKAMTSPLSYIWGAPGTGKTKHVLAACICSYLRQGKKVLLTAPTNNALEQSLRGLLRTLEDAEIEPRGTVLRIGYPSEGFKTAWADICEDGAFNLMRTRISEAISRLKYRTGQIDSSLEAREKKTGAKDLYPETATEELKKRRTEYTRWINDLLGKSRKMAESQSLQPVISEFSVIASTVDASIYRLKPDGEYRPDHVFLDEAGYCCVIKGMTLTGYGCPLTMLGDHKQLPPVFDCEDRQMLRDPERQIVRLWQVSTLYLEDAMAQEKRAALCRQEPAQPTFDHTETGALRETYRFGPALGQVLARRVYGPGFRSRSQTETKILYINVPKRPEERGKDENGRHRRTSSRERNCIREIIERNLGTWELSIGIITPYTRQRDQIAGSIHRLMKKYQRTEDMDDDIVTVHRSQGREWDVVLFSITDGFDESYFTNSARPDSLKLINTAVSRAKKLLILIGDADDWKSRDGQLIADLFRVAKESDTGIRFDRYIEEE